MKSAPLPPDERERVRELHDLNLLDSPPEARFDRVTRLARELFDVPIALISLVDSERQWFKSHDGLDARQTGRAESFCSHALLSDSVMVVENACEDERFVDNPLVTGEPAIRFYAAQSLRGPRGHRVGTLCLIDREPREFPPEQQALLRDLALVVENELQPMGTASSGETVVEDPWVRRREMLTSMLSGRGIALLCSLVMALGILLIGSRWDAQNLEEHRNLQERRVLELLGQWRGRLESELNTRLHLVHGVAGLVHAEREVTDETFQRFAEKMAGDVSAIRSLQLAPGGVVTLVWPFESNRAAIGHDLLGDPARRVAAEAAIKQRGIWIAGPLRLIQGGVALIGRRPIFLGDAADGAEEKFWGFATILIDLPEFLDSIGLQKEQEGIRFGLRGTDSLGVGGDVFFGDPDVFSGEVLRVGVTLPAGSWQLAGKPVTGWSPTWPGQARFRVALMMGAALAALLLYFLMRSPARLRERVNAALASQERSAQQFSDAVEALQEGFAIYDAADRLVAFNERFRDLYSVCEPVIRVGASFEEIARYGVAHGQFAGVSADVPGALQSGVEARLALHRRPEIRFEEHLRDGRWLQVVERRMRDGGTVTFHLDITELKDKEQELIDARQRAEVANQAKSAFLATVSHEVRTPLNSVLGLIGLLKDVEELPARERERAETAHQSAQHLLIILNEILDISKMEENRLELEEGPFCPAETVHSVFRLIEGVARKKGLEMKLSQAPLEGRWVLGDEGRFRQVVLNIVSNAVKFTDHGHVELRADCVETDDGGLGLKIAVQDTGIGFDDASAEQLFEPFSQLEAHSSRRYEGTGLGLAICKRLVSLMGGSLEGTGKVGEGACFTLSLELPSTPAPQDAGPESGDAALTPAELGWRDIRVLLVEDSPTNQIVFQSMMEGTGYRVDVAASGEEALHALQDLPYDLVMMDVYMPGMDGLQTTQALRKLDACREIPVIALTANAMRGDRERFIAAGMDDYLPKPIDKRDLLATMRKWAARRLDNGRGDDTPITSTSHHLESTHGDS